MVLKETNYWNSIMTNSDGLERSQFINGLERSQLLDNNLENSWVLPKCVVFTKIQFYQNLRFFTKICIYTKNPQFSPKSTFFYQNLQLSPNFVFFSQNLQFFKTCRFFYKLQILENCQF